MMERTKCDDGREIRSCCSSLAGGVGCLNSGRMAVTVKIEK
jgi:hypothetical protein